jgi:DNA-binding response OmpR family regulator
MATVPALETSAPQRILLVDDNRDAAEFLAALLRMDGHDVSLAFDGEEALQSAAAFRPEAALIDLGLPGIDGCEVAIRLRSLQATPPILMVAVTGWGSADDKARADKAGFDRYLTKPIDYDTVRELLDNARV